MDVTAKAWAIMHDSQKSTQIPSILVVCSRPMCILAWQILFHWGSDRRIGVVFWLFGRVPRLCHQGISRLAAFVIGHLGFLTVSLI